MDFFVYGTLRQGYGNHTAFLEGRFENKVNGAVKGYKMKSLGAFPMVFKSQNDEDEVKGEVYTVQDPAVLKDLDRLEGNGSFYFRKKCEVHCDDGEVRNAWIYEGKMDARYINLKDVEGGDWTQWQAPRVQT